MKKITLFMILFFFLPFSLKPANYRIETPYTNFLLILSHFTSEEVKELGEFCNPHIYLRESLQSEWVMFPLSLIKNPKLSLSSLLSTVNIAKYPNTHIGFFLRSKPRSLVVDKFIYALTGHFFENYTCRQQIRLFH